MDEIQRIRDQLEQAHSGSPWWGPSLRSVLEGIGAEQASRRLLPRVHTVWEIVLHLTSWQREAARRLRDGVARSPADGDWPPPPATVSAAAWDAARRALDSAHDEILLALDELPPARLLETVREEREGTAEERSFYVLLHGILQHNVAHAAQISLLKKALG